MTKKWKIVEKAAGLTLIAFGIYLLYTIQSILTAQWVFYFSGEKSDTIPFYYFLISNSLLIILFTLSTIGGFLLLWHKKTGWILSIAAYFSFVAISIISLLQFVADLRPTEHILDFAPFLFLDLIALILGCFLSTQKFRVKYYSDFKSWLWILSIIIFFILNKLILSGVLL